MDNILSDNEREALLNALKNAPDEILIDAVRQRKDMIHQINSSFKEVRSFCGLRVIEAPVAKFSGREIGAGDSDKKVNNAVQEPAHPTTRANKSPGASSITKIGGKTKDEILGVLKAGRQPNHDKYGEHLKLLWKREIVKFDGAIYYI